MQVANDKGFVCLATSKGSNHQHIVYVYGADQQLVYADSTTDDAAALLALKSAGSSAFLVGGRNVIWKYTEKR